MNNKFIDLFKEMMSKMCGGCLGSGWKPTGIGPGPGPRKKGEKCEYCKGTGLKNY